MSYIAHLATLAKESQEEEIKRKIKEAQDDLLKDKSRTALLDDEDLDSFNDVDEITLETVHIDEERKECTASFAWSSFGPKDEDDERFIYGNATVHLGDDESISFSDASAELDGTDGRRSGDNRMDEEEQQRRQDEDDYTEKVTKDW